MHCFYVKRAGGEVVNIHNRWVPVITCWVSFGSTEKLPFIVHMVMMCTFLTELMLSA